MRGSTTGPTATIMRVLSRRPGQRPGSRLGLAVEPAPTAKNPASIKRYDYKVHFSAGQVKLGGFAHALDSGFLRAGPAISELKPHIAP